MMGPAAGSSQWKHATDKWQTRALSIAHSGATPAISALLYNSRALPTLGYISQLCTLPKNFRRKEVGIANSIMHLPASTLSASTAFTWSSGGAPKILSGVVMNRAILLRTALQTVPNWPMVWEAMMDAAEDLPIARARNSEPWDCHWDAPAFAANLRNAAAGDGFRKLEAKTGRRASQQVVSTFLCKVQKLATKAFSEALYPSKISKTLACRFERCFPNEENMPSLEDWENVYYRTKEMQAICSNSKLEIHPQRLDDLAPNARGSAQVLYFRLR